MTLTWKVSNPGSDELLGKDTVTIQGPNIGICYHICMLIMK